MFNHRAAREDDLEAIAKLHVLSWLMRPRLPAHPADWRSEEIPASC